MITGYHDINAMGKIKALPTAATIARNEKQGVGQGFNRFNQQYPYDSFAVTTSMVNASYYRIDNSVSYLTIGRSHWLGT